MNELQIFNNEELKKLKASNEYLGFFYVIEYGNALKIGSTKSPYERVRALRRQAEKYGDKKIGRLAFSREHTNYRENEKQIHVKFSKYRKKDTELFDMKLEDVLFNISKMSLLYEDNSEARDKRAIEFCETMKRFICGGELK